jgi:Leucine-rich repeat (LRR) protein
LALSHCHLTDDELKHIGRLKELESLDLTDNDISDEGLKNFEGLKNVNSLVLRKTKVTKVGLSEFSKRNPKIFVSSE